MKNCIILLTLCFAAYAQACLNSFRYKTKAGVEHVEMTDSCKRTCSCVKNVNTHIIGANELGVTRVFRSADCSGAYQTIKPGTKVKNMEWVNSVSFGPSGASIGPKGCPSSYPTVDDFKL
ncbi:unnamed protein product [Cunninghamella echinulata]